MGLLCYLREWLICMVNVGKYPSPMDPMGPFVFWLGETEKMPLLP